MKGKLSPCYVGSYQILRYIDKVAYEVEFPNAQHKCIGILCLFVEKVCWQSDVYSIVEKSWS